MVYAIHHIIAAKWKTMWIRESTRARTGSDEQRGELRDGGHPFLRRRIPLCQRVIHRCQRRYLLTGDWVMAQYGDTHDRMFQVFAVGH